MNKDSIGNTFFIATTLCLICSAVVALAAVGLKPFQDFNKALDKKKNILVIAGLFEKGKTDVNQVFASLIDDRVIDLDSGDDVTSEYAGKQSDFDAEANLNEDSDGSDVDPKRDIAVLKRREHRSHVYVVKKSETDATPRMYIFPIRGKGLWSTLRGFFAIDPDIKTVRGITYYEHAETPGLGGEVDNPDWKKKWPGKIAFDDAGKVIIRVTKNVSTNSDIDALSGSTITSNGVTNMLRFWLGPDGFGPYLNRIQPGSSTQTVTNQK